MLNMRWSTFKYKLLPAIKLYLLGFIVMLRQLIINPLALPGINSQDAMVAIVTGGSKGIGFEVARYLAKLGVHVIIGGRNELEGDAAIRRICKEFKKAKVEFSKLDLASLASVRAFAQSFKEKNLPLNLLINNASVMLVPEGRTEDGFELHFGVNYLGHFLLTWLLLDTLKESGKHLNVSRVINVSSSAHVMGEIDPNDLNFCEHYSPHAAYSRSKLAQILFSYQLDQKMQDGGFPVVSCAVDPGMVDTSLYRHLWTPFRIAQRAIAYILFRTPIEGAATVLWAAVSPVIMNGSREGGYWKDGHREMSSPPTFDKKLQQSLWEITIQLLKLQ